jgi:hypothetical protein
MSKRFELLFRPVHGHRYWRDNQTNLVAISDESGSTPDRTDDGVLWLDTDRAIQASGSSFLIPIIVERSGRKCATPCNAIEARMVCEAFEMKLLVDGAIFKLEKAA